MLLDKKVFATFVVDRFLGGRVQLPVAFQDNLLDVNIALDIVLTDLSGILAENPIILQVEHAQIAIQNQLFAFENTDDLLSLDEILANLQILQFDLFLLLQSQKQLEILAANVIRAYV